MRTKSMFSLNWDIDLRQDRYLWTPETTFTTERGIKVTQTETTIYMSHTFSLPSAKHAFFGKLQDLMYSKYLKQRPARTFYPKNPVRAEVNNAEKRQAER